MKNDIEIKDDIYSYIKGSALEKAINGELRKNKRSPNSDKEDVVIAVIANDNGQTQEAIVNVNVFVKDIYIDKQYEVNSGRCRELGKICENLFEVFRGDSYRCTLDSQRVMEVNGANEHFINNRLLYRNNNE